MASQESIREDYSKLSELSNLIAKYSDNPLMFWADNAANYPVLQQLASLFLGMSAGSVPVECLFSITGLISSSRRSSICPSKLNKISFLTTIWISSCPTSDQCQVSQWMSQNTNSALKTLNDTVLYCTKLL